ncbi:MAG: DUF1905 domain-containing protein [Actinomycetota bacterium]|nr:DUF1905 domain-containing protein [Actinomycetota bacterium]
MQIFEPFEAAAADLDLGTWVFVRVPDASVPDNAGAWGRTPIVATVDGFTWATSVWRDTRHGWLLPIPKARRANKGRDHVYRVELSEDPERPLER